MIPQHRLPVCRLDRKRLLSVSLQRADKDHRRAWDGHNLLLLDIRIKANQLLGSSVRQSAEGKLKKKVWEQWKGQTDESDTSATAISVYVSRWIPNLEKTMTEDLASLEEDSYWEEAR